MKRRNALPVLAAAALVAIGVAGCTAPKPVATAAPSPTVSATPEPTPDAPAIDRIEVRSTGLELWAADTLISEIGWFDEPVESIDVLSEAFGFEPTEVDYPGHIEAAPGIDYTWEGFVYRVQDFTPEPPLWNNVSVLATAATVSDVDITVAGVRIGDSYDAALEAGPVDVSEPFDGQVWMYFDTFVHEEPADPHTTPSTNWAGLRVSVTDQAVLEIFAPMANYGV